MSFAHCISITGVYSERLVEHPEALQMIVSLTKDQKNVLEKHRANNQKCIAIIVNATNSAAAKKWLLDRQPVLKLAGELFAKIEEEYGNTLKRLQKQEREEHCKAMILKKIRQRQAADRRRKEEKDLARSNCREKHHINNQRCIAIILS